MPPSKETAKYHRFNHQSRVGFQFFLFPRKRPISKIQLMVSPPAPNDKEKSTTEISFPSSQASPEHAYGSLRTHTKLLLLFDQFFFHTPSLKKYGFQMVFFHQKEKGPVFSLERILFVSYMFTENMKLTPALNLLVCFSLPLIPVILTVSSSFNFSCKPDNSFVFHHHAW